MKSFKKRNPLKITLDADGVLIDYNTAASRVWGAAFGAIPEIKNPRAYHFHNKYHVDLSDEAVKNHYYETFARQGWIDMPAMPRALEGCQMLVDAGYELHVVTAMPQEFVHFRRENFKDLKFPVASVTATGGAHAKGNPKKETLLALQPVAFVDDLLSNFEFVNHAMHCALLHWECEDNPNDAHEHLLKHSSHSDMVEFATFWISEQQSG